MPKKHDQKKWTHQYPWKKREKKENIYIYIAMSSCYPNKGERFIKGVFHSIIYLPHMCTILISLFDLSSPWTHFLISQYMWHKCMIPFLLPWAPDKLSLEVGWKQAMLWWGYIHNGRHERTYGEVKLWLFFAKKYFQNPRHMAGKWRKLKSA